VVTTGLRLLHGSGCCDDREIADFRSRARFEEALATASGELELMDLVVTALESERLGGGRRRPRRGPGDRSAAAGLR
jgi:hypothetical protein